MIAILIPVLAYGVICAFLGIWVEQVTRPYRKSGRR
jgi:hypothetical protein